MWFGIALPLLAYFAIMWTSGYLAGAARKLGYRRATTLAFTSAATTELAIAVAIATSGPPPDRHWPVSGPLIEVPVLVGLVYVSLALARRFPAVTEEHP